MEFDIPPPYSNIIRGSAKTLNKQYQMSVKTVEKKCIWTGAPDLSEIPSQCFSKTQGVFLLTLYGASYSNKVRGSIQTLKSNTKYSIAILLSL